MANLLCCTVIIATILLAAHCASALDTLFRFDEPIAQFTQDNFTSTVIGSDFAWVIDFYASWCGHCQRFVPVWVDLARKIKGWRRVIRIGAVACSDPVNYALCRYYGVRGYPTVKFFPSNSASQNKGLAYKGKKSVDDLRNGIIDYVDEVTCRSSGLPLKAVRSIGEAKRLNQRNTRHLFLVVTESDKNSTRMAKGAILDLSARFPEVVVAWTHKNLLSIYDSIYQFPASVYKVLEADITRIEGKAEFSALITSHARETDRTTTRSTARATAPSTTRPIHTTTTSPTTTTTSSYIPSDGLHSQDLDSGVYYSYWVEIPSHRKIGKRALSALKRHVHIMAKYHPGSTHVVKFLKRVHNWLSKVEKPLTGEQWLSNITRLQRTNAYVPQSSVWTGCKGSASKFRGYPCSFWMTYHALSVNAYLSDDRRRPYNPKTVLLSMREYVRHFLGCRECANHFTSGMAANIEKDVKHAIDGVLYLWEIHNSVNARLHGDPTEDPAHKKIQFPAAMACSECRRYGSGRYNPNVTWSDVRVLAYLVNFYRSENVIWDSAQSKLPARVKLKQIASPSCVHNNTQWSECSRSCDTGFSVRVSNNNPQCRSEIQFRFCQIRPCRMKSVTTEKKCKNKKTPSTYRNIRKSRFVYGNCRSVNKYTWHYCGHCTDKCCRPAKQNTVTMEMECRESGRVHRTSAKVHRISSCKCVSGKC